MKIGKFSIGQDQPPFVIAEMSGNHNQSLQRALDIVDAAAAAGAHALKIQTYTAETMTLDCDREEFCIRDQQSLWAGKYLYQLYEEAHTPWEWHKPIFDRATQKGMLALSTPFDETSVDFLEELGVTCYKIASFENNDIPLLRKVAATGKPIIVSTGMATIGELDELVRTIRTAGRDDFVLLKCTSTYPTSPENSNLRTIPHLRELFGCEVGLSDHTLGVGVAVAAVALGATVVEKHFTLDRAQGGLDAAFSLEPPEFRLLVEETNRAWQGLGGISYGPTFSELKSLQFRRSIYVAHDIAMGDLLTTKNLRVVRPGFGLHPRYFDLLLGKRAARSARKGDPATLELLAPFEQ
jgi:N-acetylneuraminate synthase